ncbi:hypothetical protein [Serratia entomophila]|uniref:hypothetical protein n=1 Tax=Serratia entomophila TaxID=42906 RepID=UPI00217732B1|nr:hypothetical protein [Serratia entomophila]CAI2057156.1 Uncharacterised protein [Serratia entomophila]
MEKFSVLINAFNKHIETAGLGDDDVVTVRECRDALVHVVEQQQLPCDVREFSAEMLSHANDMGSSLSDDVRAGMRSAAMFADTFIALRTELEAPDEKISARRQEVLRALTERAEAAEQRTSELDASETQLIQERDDAEAALADMYEAATGERPEWSNWFGFADAVEEVAQVCARLATPVRFPNEDAALAMFDIFYQTERDNHGNVQIGFSDAKAIGEWIAKTLELRGDGFECEVGQ